ncbi:MAG: PPOX class F420-dependent oxidoreductase [Chloroflexota bacterium]
MNRGLSVEQLDGLLDERRLAVMSTFRADGTVLLSPLWFVWEDGGFTIAMAAGDGKLKHLRRDPRVTIVVNEDDFPYRGFEVRGVAMLLDAAYGPVVRRIATRYVGEAASAFYDDEHGGTVARIEPGHARGWDFRDDLAAMGVL